MSLNEIIPPEVLNDQFYFSLIHCASRTDVKTILEIGICYGGSIQLWNYFFTNENVKIIGVDINSFDNYLHKNHSTKIINNNSK